MAEISLHLCQKIHAYTNMNKTTYKQQIKVININSSL
jgi:hypothetical protein